MFCTVLCGVVALVAGALGYAFRGKIHAGMSAAGQDVKSAVSKADQAAKKL